jgi:hypothetical protein
VARGILVGLLSAGFGFAQEPALIVRAEEPLQPLRSALDSPAPALRAEAAIALARHRQPEDFPRLLDAAQDEDPTARASGIVALGIHGGPGAASVLIELLDGSRRDAPERVCAAFAIGLLPPGQMQPRLAEYLSRLNGSNLRREHDVLAALFAGATVQPQPSWRTALRDILIDEANKAVDLKVQILRALARIPEALDAAEIEALLEAEDPKLRAALLDYLRLAPDGARFELTPERRDRILRLVERDLDAGVRAAALRLVVQRRLAAALELGARAIRSNDDREVAAGVEAVLHLGGGKLAQALESRALDGRRPATRAMILAALPGSTTTSFLDACLALALETRADLLLRAQAAALLARSGDARAAAVLRTLFVGANKAQEVALIAAALARFDLHEDLDRRCYPAKSADDLRRLPARVQGLAAAGVDPARIVAEILSDESLPPELVAQVLRAERLGRARLIGTPGELPVDDSALLPPQLSALLR